MIVPQYWAEGRVQKRAGGRQTTVRRFGWSDESQEAAQAHADQRAREAMARLDSGETVARREPKRAYNGADGVPIREEIVARHGDTVITRNAYGARCLNTPNVLFVDVDFASEPSFRFALVVFALLALAAGGLGVATRSLGYAVFAGIVALFATPSAAPALHRLRLRLQGGAEAIARRRMEAFLAARPAWSLRLYRTPAGFRLLATHRTFDPLEPEVADGFTALGADRIYARMCRNQRCFRARVSPKPWRIGIDAHLRPRPGVWPVAEHQLPVRRRWIDEYERRAPAFASCRFVASLGSGAIAPAVEEVLRLHDRLCRAEEELPIA